MELASPPEFNEEADDFPWGAQFEDDTSHLVESSELNSEAKEEQSPLSLLTMSSLGTENQVPLPVRIWEEEPPAYDMCGTLLF